MNKIWIKFAIFFIYQNISKAVDETNLIVESNESPSGSCSPGWNLVGKFCYKVTKGIGEKVFDFDRSCSDNNGTFPTFPSLQDYIDFSDFWAKLPNKPTVLLGYHHKEYEAKYSDVVNYYSQAAIPFVSQFCTGEPDMLHNDNCICIGKKGTKCWSDIPCHTSSSVVICQQTQINTTKMHSIPCGPVCRATSEKGHKFASANSWICQYNATVENKAIAYTQSQYIPGMTEYLFLTANQAGKLLNVFGHKGLEAVPSNQAERYFLVSTVKMNSNMAKFYLMINSRHNDTIICQFDDDECKNLLSQGWTNQSSFYMFIKMDNYRCKFSNATDDSSWVEFENITQDQGGVESDMQGQQTSAVSMNEICSNGWFQVNKFCYKIVSHEGPRTIESYDETCANMNATLATFPVEKDYLDFYKRWNPLSKKYSTLLLGYTHDKGEADYSDIINYYSQKKINFPDYFLYPNPDFSHNDDYCIHMKPYRQLSCMNDVSCSDTTLKPVCQQVNTNYAVASFVNCVQLCRSKTSNGHRFTISLKHCRQEAKVENAETAFAFVGFVPGLTAMVYEMKSRATGNTLMVYGQKGLSSLDVSYEYQRSIIVGTEARSTMDQFVLMINSQGDDTIICKNNSDEHKSLLARSWRVQQSFFLFSQNDGLTCMISKPNASQIQMTSNSTDGIAATNACNWTDWKTMTPCNTTCGRGFETKIRFETCKGVVIIGKNETVTLACFVAKCKYQQKACGQVLASQPGTVKTAFAVESLFQCGKACNFYSWCSGVNFHPPNGYAANCELIKKDDSMESFTCAVGWTFYEKF